MNRALFLLVLSAPSGFALGGGGSWQTLPDLQLARQETGAALLDGKVYVVGGLIGSTQWTATDTVEAYDPVAGAWSYVAPLPVPLDHMGVAALDGKLYVIGGYSADFVPRSGVWIYDPASNGWSSGTPLPQARGAPWAVAHGGRIFVFGGVGPGVGATRTTWIYDPATSGWTQGSDMPTRREHLNAASFGPWIFVIGGRDGGAVHDVNERYDPHTDTWVTLTPMPTARSAMGLAAVDNRLYALGGEAPVLHPENESYDPLTEVWTSGPPLPVPRHGIAAVVLDGGIVLAGGGIVQGLGPTDHVDAFVPDPVSGVEYYCFCAHNAPCANEDALRGCESSAGEGGLFTAAGTTSIAADDLFLTASHLPPSQLGLVFAGAGAVEVWLGDGIRCVGPGGQGFFRFPAQDSGGTGTIHAGPGILQALAGSALGGVLPGSKLYFQTWYRDPLGPCGLASNLTHALTVTFAP